METFFPLSAAYKYGIETAKYISDEIVGREVFSGKRNAGLLAQTVVNALHGDHVEIGTLFGASAILAALAKKEFGLHGKVYCVDPLEFRPNFIDDRFTGFPASSTLLKENACRFGVEDRIIHVPKCSYPWPLPDKLFATGFVDGDHWNGTPLKDWESLSKCVTYSVVLHDYMPHKPEVVDLVRIALESREWAVVAVDGVTAVLRRRH